MHPMFNGLPQELNDEIIDNLWNDTQALKSCSLACRSFKRTCQKYLFSSIVIYPPSYKKKWISTAFRDLLESSPHLAKHVHYLNIIDRHTAPKITDEWLSKDTALVLCLPLLRNLRGLVIQYQKYYYYQIPGVWSAMMRSGLLAAIDAILHLPTLTLLDLTGFPLDLVKNCPNLRHLSIDDPILLKVDLQVGFHPKVQLESLEVFAHEIYSLQMIPQADNFDHTYPEALVKLCSESVDITKLKRLYASAEGCSHAGGHGLLAYIIKECAGTLQELVFSPSNGISWGGESAETIQWGALTSLRKFDISFTWEGSDGGYDYTGPWPWFIRVFKELFPTNALLEEFILHIKYDLEDDDPFVENSDEGWPVLLSMLGDRKRFPVLRKVDVQLSTYKDNTRISSGLRALINSTASTPINLTVTVLDDMYQNDRHHGLPPLADPRWSKTFFEAWW